jgi:hypothetical protein
MRPPENRPRPASGALLAIGVLVVMAGLTHAQQTAAPTTAAAPAAAAPADTARTADAGEVKLPSAETIKKARLAGYKPEKHKGAIQFCMEDADIGTHFKTKKCYDEDRLALILQQQQLQREQLLHIGCTGGGACGGQK